MFIAADTASDRVVTAAEIQASLPVPGRGVEVSGPNATPGDTASGAEFACPVCGDPVRMDQGDGPGSRGAFRHEGGGSSCIGHDAMLPAHRGAVEMSVSALAELLGGAASIGVEERIGGQDDHITADVAATGSVPVAVEVFNECSYLDLRRRLTTYFRHGFDVFLVFVEGGKYNPARVEQHLQSVAAVPGLRVGRYDHESGEIELGSRFSRFTCDVTGLNGDGVPEYIA